MVARPRRPRFRPALHYYLAAVAAGIGGTALGAAMVTGHAGLRDAHVIVNLLGLLGMVIAGTLPFFTATQARMKMSPRATPVRLHRNLVVLGTSVTVAALGAYLEHPLLEAAGLVASVAYLAPVLRGGGHQRLTAGFALTRSWTALATANAAAVAWIAGRTQLAGAAIIALTVEVAVRGARAGLISARHPQLEPAVTRRDSADV